MTFHLYFRKAHSTAARMTGLRLGSCPPPVRIPMQRIRRHCTVMVKGLLLIPLRLAVTLVVAPEVAVESTAPLPFEMVAITAVLLLVQLT